jgi:hypothetical protein
MRDAVAGMTEGYPGNAAGGEAGRLARELCHDLIDSAAAIKVLAHVADAEAGADPAAGSLLRNHLNGISAAAGQIAEVCERVLKQGGLSL